MTVASAVNRTTVSGNGSATSFAYTFPIQSSSHLVVIRTTAAGVDTTLTLGTHYSVSGVGEAGGGSITYPLSGSALPSGDRLTLMRVVPLTQLVDLTNQGAFYAEVHENEFDLHTMADQQLDERLDRALLVPASDVAALTEMPNATDRASKYLAFDSSGNPIATAGAASGTPVSAFMATVLDDTTAAAARTTLGLGFWVSVTHYGAVGGGTTDDTTAFQLAFAAVAAAGGGTVFVPAGVWKIVCPSNNYIALIAAEGIQFAGMGDGATELYVYTTATYGEILRISSNNFTWRDMTIRAKNAHTLVAGGIECDSNENIAFKDMSVVKDGVADFLPFKMMGTGTLKGLEFHSVLFSGTSYAIWSANDHTGVTYATRITNCEFRGLTGDAIALNHPSGTGAWHDTTISDCHFRDFAGVSYASGLGISIARCAEVMISGCVWEGYPYDAIHIEDQSRLITIVGCSFGKSGYSQYAAITIMGVSEQITITGCQFDTHSDPVSRTTPCILITGGGVMPSGANGPATDIIITGCHFDLHVHACQAVLATGYGEFTFSDNRVYGSGTYNPANGGVTGTSAVGLTIHDQSNMMITGNRFTKLKDGILGVHAAIAGGSYSQIIGNQFYECQDGIEINSPAHVMISNNFMRRCGRPWALTETGTAIPAGGAFTNNYAADCYQTGYLSFAWGTNGPRFWFGNVDTIDADDGYPSQDSNLNTTPLDLCGVKFSGVYYTPTAGQVGTVRWSTAVSKLQVWTGAAWVDLH